MLLQDNHAGCSQQINPSQQKIAHAGGTATFTCSGTRSSDPPTNITWVFSSSILMNNSSNVVERFDSSIHIGRLTIQQLQAFYNKSQIRCSVLFSSGSMVTSNPSTLLVLGKWLILIIQLAIYSSLVPRLSSPPLR